MRLTGTSSARANHRLTSTARSTVSVSAETLADALVSAYRNSNLLDQNRAVLRAADEDAALAIAALRPVVGWVVDSGYAKTRLGEGVSTSLGLTTQMTLFDFGRSKQGTVSCRFKEHWGFEARPLPYAYHLVRSRAVPWRAS